MPSCLTLLKDIAISSRDLAQAYLEKRPAPFHDDPPSAPDTYLEEFALPGTEFGSAKAAFQGLSLM